MISGPILSYILELCLLTSANINMGLPVGGGLTLQILVQVLVGTVLPQGNTNTGWVVQHQNKWKQNNPFPFLKLPPLDQRWMLVRCSSLRNVTVAPPNICLLKLMSSSQFLWPSPFHFQLLHHQPHHSRGTAFVRKRKTEIILGLLGGTKRRNRI